MISMLSPPSYPCVDPFRLRVMVLRPLLFVLGSLKTYVDFVSLLAIVIHQHNIIPHLSDQLIIIHAR